MSLEVSTLLLTHPTNEVNNPRYYTPSRKPWVEEYLPITKVNVYTRYGRDGVVEAKFDGPLLPPLEDDEIRLAEPAYPPNDRQWRMEMEADIANWFHHEISNIVLPAWKNLPSLLQTSETSALREDQVTQHADVLYSTYVDRMMTCVLVGEMKRNLILPQHWLSGKPCDSKTQASLSQELRG